MYDDGYHDIVNLDVSPVVVTAMQHKYIDKAGLVYQQGNVVDMKEFTDSYFDAVIDKGTMDSILCGEASTHTVQAMLREVSRVLKATGVYVVVSYGQPSYRMSFLQRNEYGWGVHTSSVQKPLMGLTGSTMTADEKDNCHYIYICSKSGVSNVGGVDDKDS
eukprot:GHVR01111525.1.p1 GENE.GHVR01111525.1~~GHVR01111525.1.p1  ORF type:complete len:161 (+),score=38.57 GHVR01111525.1:377-859(+)